MPANGRPPEDVVDDPATSPAPPSDVPPASPAEETHPSEPSVQPLCDEVNGVPVIHVPGQSREVTGGLFFRVGTADETVASAGITHLVEHLAVSAVRTGDADENGRTSDRWTLFHATGSREQVTRYLNGICAALRDLAMDRLDREKQIIRTEAARRGGTSSLRTERYGAGSYGLSALEEFGMLRLEAQEVLDWSRAWFTSGNAVAFLDSAEIPDDLDLRLPAGPRRPDPEPSQNVVATPCYVCKSTGGIALSGIVERSSAGQVYARIAARRLFSVLREERGLSYVADSAYEVRDATSATITLVADALPDKLTEMATTFLEIVKGLPTREISDAELHHAMDDVKRGLTGASALQLLPNQALAVLDQRPLRARDDLMADLETVTADEVREIGRQVWNTTIVDCDTGAIDSVEAAGVEFVSHGSPAPVPASVPFKRTGFNADVFYLGDHGVTFQTGRKQYTVMFDESPALLCWPDGGRMLMAPDASVMTIEPGLYSGMSRGVVQRMIDAKMDPTKIVLLPERDKKDIPRFGAKQVIYVIALIVLLAISIPMIIAALVAGFTDSAATGIGVAVMGAPFWIATAWLLVAGRRSRRRPG